MTGSSLTRPERDRVEALERRLEHLEERLANWNPLRDPSRTRAERAALDWALRVIDAAPSSVMDDVRAGLARDRSMRGTTE